VPGEPLLIKISYHPGWKVLGARKIFPVSPSFMLIYPEDTKIRLYYSKTMANYAGLILSACGIFLLIMPCFKKRMFVLTKLYNNCLDKISLILVLCFCLVIVFFLICNRPDYAVTKYNQALTQYNKGNFIQARKAFESLDYYHFDSIISGEVLYHLAMIFFREKKFSESITRLQKLIKKYPDTGRIAESYYHIALCNQGLGKKFKANEFFKQTIKLFPDSEWAKLSETQLLIP
jgi:tetratricopeptide (TPR) repeat protein